MVRHFCHENTPSLKSILLGNGKQPPFPFALQDGMY